MKMRYLLGFLLLIGSLTFAGVDADELYDVRPYLHIPTAQISEVTGRNAPIKLYPQDLEIYENALNYCDVDEEFKVYINVMQLRIRQGYPCVFLNENFQRAKKYIKHINAFDHAEEMRPDLSYFVIPKISLFFYWKHIAYINPSQAESLADTLENGYQDLVPSNPEWASWWRNRANLLKSPHPWHMPPNEREVYRGTEEDIYAWTS